ncbi:unnamed protein product, partial [Ixodes pacificus]
MTPRVGSALQLPSSIQAGLPLADWPCLRAAAGRSPWGEPGEEQRLDRVTIRPEDSRSPRSTQAAGYSGPPRRPPIWRDAWLLRRRDSAGRHRRPLGNLLFPFS